MSSSLSSLLTANERHTFDAFLSDVGADDLGLVGEWQQYSHLAPAHPDGTDALSQATKDLIALHPPPKLPAQQRPIAPAPPRASTSRAASSLAAAAVSSRSRTASPARKRARSASPTPGAKSTLLTAQQKKANHIQSEQKRRANIRRGYEALCETVPALRETGAAAGEDVGAGASAGGRGRRKRARAEDGADGRAGPRSESVVLQKTIEHIRGMLDEKSALLARLGRARAALGDGHPALYSHAYAEGRPLWERDWDGGKGAMMDVDAEEDSDFDD